MHERLIARITERLFARPVMQNDVRSIYVEHLVEELLGQTWRLTSGNWSGWDLEGPNGRRLEVKQSAARQSWAPPKQRASPSFDIKTRKGYWTEGGLWVAEDGRHAHYFVFCWHPRDDDACDQRRADQWQFYVVPSIALPNQNRISLGPLSRLAQPVPATELRSRLDSLIRTGSHA